MNQSTASKNIVYLVGAGPGDPGLFTLRGRELLERAEVVVYDYLANPALLNFAAPSAELIYVGKKGGDHTLTQDGINQLLVEKGRDHVVVRLKGGDPFIFGRGGEEAEELVKAGIPFEIVPGVSSTVAAPAYAGIPLSHRDFTANMAFVTGHERSDSEDSKINWKALAEGVETLVFVMGMKNLPTISENLIGNGKSPETAVAVIRWGTTPNQRTVTGTLSDIVEQVEKAHLKPPCVIVVGGVVGLREKLNWFEKRPLFGCTIVVTRAREQASDFREILAERGARTIEFPTISIAPPPSWEPLDKAITRLTSYHWLIFTSVNGVRYFFQRLFAAERDVRDLAGLKIAAIGPKTAEAVRNHGIRLDLVPGEYRAEAILDGLDSEELENTRFLLPRAMVARDILPDTLRERGAHVDVVPTYETVLPSGPTGELAAALDAGEVDCITFTSSSTVSNFFKVLPPDQVLPRLKGVAIASIGPITSETAREYGLEVTIEPADYTIPALADAIAEYFANR